MRFAEQEGLRKVTKVELEVNELSQLEIEIIEEAFKILSENTPLEGSRLVIHKVPARFICNNCGYRWDLKEALAQLESAAEQHGIADEEGTVDPPTHYMPMLVYSFMKCPRCGSRDFEVENPFNVRVRAIEGEK